MELNTAKAEAAKLAAELERLKEQIEKDQEKKRKEKKTIQFLNRLLRPRDKRKAPLFLARDRLLNACLRH